MKVHFKYPRSLDGKHYTSGVHETPDAYVDHWFFKALLESKDAEILEVEKCKDEDPILKDEDPLSKTKSSKRSKR